MAANHQLLMSYGGASAPTTDPYWASVVLSMPMQGTNGQTSTVDVSSYARTITRRGIAALTTTQSYGGSSSMDLSYGASEGHWECADAPELDMDAGEWTVEAYIRSGSGGGGFGHWYTKSINAADGMTLGIAPTTAVHRASGTNDLSASFASIQDTWKHCAWVRDASNVRRIYIDGVQVASGTLSFTQTNTQVLLIGHFNNTSFAANGYLAHVRVTKGVCRYPGGTTFTPPSAPFPTTA
jgi:hypothetical protein